MLCEYYKKKPKHKKNYKNYQICIFYWTLVFISNLDKLSNVHQQSSVTDKLLTYLVRYIIKLINELTKVSNLSSVVLYL